MSSVGNCVARCERTGTVIFWGLIAAFEVLGIFLARHPAWDAGDAADGGHAEPVAMPRILLVEDNEDVRGLYRDVFAREGYAVLEAGDGPAALAAVEHDRPDAVVLGIDLARRDGLWMVERLHALDHDLPVILNTPATARPETRAAADGAAAAAAASAGDLPRAVLAAIDAVRDAS